MSNALRQVNRQIQKLVRARQKGLGIPFGTPHGEAYYCDTDRPTPVRVEAWVFGPRAMRKLGRLIRRRDFLLGYRSDAAEQQRLKFELSATYGKLSSDKEPVVKLQLHSMYGSFHGVPARSRYESKEVKTFKEPTLNADGTKNYYDLSSSFPYAMSFSAPKKTG